MGIRFYCPQGHKLNVKSFLAGKKGFCPHCNAKVDIPLRSTRPSSKEDKQKTVSSVMTVPVAGPAASGAAPEAPLARPVAAPSSGAPLAVPVAASGLGAIPQSMPGAAVLQPAALPTNAWPGATLNAAMPTGSSAPAVPTVAATTTVASATAADPISEAPHAVWYVRPALGGQYGPASGDMLRQWVQQGRVASDSLVWRDGWPTWQTAGSVFPQLAGPTIAAPSGLPEAALMDLQLPLDPLSLPTSGSLGRPLPRKRSNLTITLIVGLLVVVALGLAGVLLVMLSPNH